MHYGGLPCDLDELQSLAKKYKIPLIEDAAHAVGATSVSYTHLRAHETRHALV